MPAPDRSLVLAVVRVAALTVGISVVLSLVGVPSAVLFGGLLGGMAHALTSGRELDVPKPVFRLAQALVGAIIGTQIDAEALRQIGQDVVPLTVVTVLTVGVSIVGGLLLARRRDVSAVTGVCALIAGGASGVVAIARDLGADDRVVTVVQYLRVAIVLLSLPFVTALVFDPPSGLGDAQATSGQWSTGLLYTALTVAGGLVLARLVPLTTMTLLGPLLVGAVLAATDVLGGALEVPVVLTWLAYALIGVQVGLRFTRASLSSITRMLPVVVALILGLMVVTGLLGVGLVRFTDVDGLTAYLATTPGGLFAVLATAADAGADVTYVVAMQLFRLVVILAMIPLLARWLRRLPDA